MHFTGTISRTGLITVGFQIEFSFKIYFHHFVKKFEKRHQPILNYWEKSLFIRFTMDAELKAHRKNKDKSGIAFLWIVIMFRFFLISDTTLVD